MLKQNNGTQQGANHWNQEWHIRMVKLWQLDIFLALF